MSLKGCQAIIGRRETGKTTFLFHMAEQAIADGIPVMVIDSATEHREKSLLHKLRDVYPHTWIPSPQESEIMETLPPGDLTHMYPYSKMTWLSSGAESKLLLVDAAYYLELGYETEDLILREARRRRYKLFAAQAAWVFAAFVRTRSRRSLLLLDEIELVDSCRLLLPELVRAGCCVWAALHHLDGLASCEDLFLCGTLKNYRLSP